VRGQKPKLFKIRCLKELYIRKEGEEKEGKDWPKISYSLVEGRISLALFYVPMCMEGQIDYSDGLYA
jgi:hypothetical protein